MKICANMLGICVNIKCDCQGCQTRRYSKKETAGHHASPKISHIATALGIPQFQSDPDRICVYIYICIYICIYIYIYNVYIYICI